MSITINLNPGPSTESFGEAMARMAAPTVESITREAAVKLVNETAASYVYSAEAFGAGPDLPLPAPRFPARFTRRRRLAAVQRWVRSERARVAHVKELRHAAAMHAKAAETWAAVVRLGSEAGVMP